MEIPFLEFKPLIKNSHYQTFLASAIDFELGPPSETKHIKLSDGDTLALEVSTPKQWKKTDPSVFMVHGLCGSHKSHYMKRIAKKLYKKGIKAIRINLKGCGSGRGLARGIYHSGSSEDVFEVIEAIHKEYPLSPTILMGVSLGANISLKLGGELGEKTNRYLTGIIAISPPADLFASARLFTLPENQFYARYFLKLLLSEIDFRHKHFDLPDPKLPNNITLHEFDELYTAQQAKYANAFEYYYYASSKRVIPQITVPTKILFANDDPIIKANALDDLELPSNITVYKTEHGGHLGFMGWNVFKEFRWMDNVALQWTQQLLSGNSKHTS